MAAPLIISLEPRMLFDGAVAATVADTAHADSHATTDTAKPAAATDHAASNDSHPQSDIAATPTPTPPAIPGQTVVFIDSRVKDSDSLLKGIAAGTQVVALDASKDGLLQIADYLDQHHGVSSVEILAHGNEGDLWLGNTYLSADNVAARSAVLAEIGKDMNTGGDISIYACNTAEGARGMAFVDSLAQLTGRDIAASTNRTGVGGDWTLEIATGVIESHNVLSQQAMADYQWGLAIDTVVNNHDSGVGSLRQALSSAVAGDIVMFSGPVTVLLNSVLEIRNNVTIDGHLNGSGVPDVILDGQYQTQVLKVDAGITATLESLTITHGLVAGNGGNGGDVHSINDVGANAAAAMGGGISNQGNLTLMNVTVTANAASGGGGGGGVSTVYSGGGGGGGGGIGGGRGGHGGSVPNGVGTYATSAGGAGSANHGGYGGSYDGINMGGRGGSATGGAGGTGGGYHIGSAGGTATSGSLSIGGGGGGAGEDLKGGNGGNAAGGIYNGSSGTLTIIGTSVISNNLGAGGGGGGGTIHGNGAGYTPAKGGDAGKGVGAIWNKGTVQITTANYAVAAFFGNVGGSGIAGTGTGGTGASAALKNNIFNDGTGTTVYNYAPDVTPPTVSSIVVATSSLNSGGTSLVTITFSEAVTGFTNADLTVAHGTLSAVSSSDGGTTWTATLTAAGNINAPTNAITLNTTGVQDLAGNVGTGSGTSNNYVIHDTVAPTATIVVAANALKIGVTSPVTITFSEAVTGFTNADLTIANGTLSAVSTADGGTTWTATLTPNASTTNASNLITLDNTGVQDLSGNAGVGSTHSNSYAIDTVRPTATIVVANNTMKIGDTSLVTITFSEAVTGFTNADLTIADGTLSAVSSSDSGVTWTATFTPTASITHTSNLITLDNTGVSDTAGNAGSGSTNSNNYSIDTQRPTATIALADTALTAGETSLVTITFSEAVTGFTNADLTIGNGTLSTVSTSDGGTTWTATFTPTAGIVSATNLVSLANTGVADLVGNAGSGTTNSANFSIDTVLPTATIAVANNALKIGDTSLVTITFAQAVTGFTNADLTIANGTLSAVSSSDGGITWTANLTPTTNIASAASHITLDNTGVQAVRSGNVGTGSTLSNTYAIDTQRPTATIVVAKSAMKIGDTSLVTITFSEAVTGFTNADLTIADGTLSAVSTSNSGVTWTATFTPTANITHTSNLITLDNTGVADTVGNAGSGSTNSNNYAIDTQRPTATIALSNSALTGSETSLVTITFSEAVSGFTNSDLTIANGTLSAVSSSDAGITWTATFTPTANIASATNLISLANTGVADLAGNAGSGTTNSANFSIDTTGPTATIVVADSAMKIGDTSLVTITFSEAVTGFTNADLTIANGTLSTVSSSDSGITWTATLTPTAAITHAGNLITLDNTGVQNTTGTAGNGTSVSNTYAIDTVRPTATIVVANSAMKIGDTSLVTITFSEAVTGFTNADLTIADGTLSAVSTSDSGVTWTATFTPTANITHTSDLITLDNTGVSDTAGNAGSGSTDSNSYNIDTVRPTATIALADSALTAGETSLVTITFSEAVGGFTNSDLTIANGTLSAVSSSDGGITFTAMFTPTAGVASATNLISLANTGVADLAGNTGSGSTVSNNYAIDTVRPSATIVVADTALNIGATSQVTITFNEAVTGFTSTDMTVTNGALSNLSTSDNITWTATLTPAVGTTNASNLISLDNSGVQAVSSGNVGIGSSLSNNYAIDTQRPTASIVVAENALNIGATSLVTITFSEAVTGFTRADLTIANGTLSAVSTSDGGITWTATLTPTAGTTNASNLISLDNTGVQDAAGNSGAGSTDSNNYAIDTQRPTATIVVADNALAIGQTSLVTITFSEAVSGFTNADLSVAHGTLSAVSSSDGGLTWTATLTPTAGTTNASNLITLDNTGVQDAAGNAGSGSTDSNNYAIDTQRPTATIVVADNALAIGQTSLVTITFSEAVSGFTNADLSVAHGTLSAVSSSDGGITWTATLTPTAGTTNASNLITLDNTGVQDAAGNAGSGSTDSNNYAIDTQRPTATIVVAENALAIGQTSLVTITFSEAVTGFTNADLLIDNGTLSAVSSSDGGVTWTATLTPAAGITNTSNLIHLDNTGVSDTAGNAGTGTTDSNNYAIDTQRPTATIALSASALKAGETSVVTITFSEAVNGFDNSDLSIANGTLSAVSSSDGGITWTATFTPTAAVTDTSNVITLNNSGVTDLAGNAGSGSTDSGNYAIDTQPPTATITLANTALKIGDTSQVTIAFSEAVSGLDLNSLNVSNGTLSGLATLDGGLTWTATFTPAADITNSANLITLHNAGVQDAAGNSGIGSTVSNTYAIDTQRPTATIVVADNALAIGQTSLVTITFSEAVTGFDNTDLSVANGTLSAVSSTDGGVTWTATLTPTAGITNTSNLIHLDNSGVSDAAGNAGTGITDSNNYAIDSQAPTATIVMAQPALAAGQSSLVTITFSEAVNGFDNSDLSVANGTLSTVSTHDGGVTWTATFTPTTELSNSVNVITLNNSGVADLAGNAGSGSTDSGNYAIDTVRPTASIVLSDTALKIGETSQVTITFSQAVQGFDLSDLSVSNGTLSNLGTRDGGVTWTATFTPSTHISDSSNLITLNNSGVQTAAGSAGTGTTDSHNYVIDTVAPTVTSVVKVDTPSAPTGTSTFDLTFSEAVSGAHASDFAVLTSGSAVGTVQSVVQLDAQTYQVVVTGVSGTGTIGLSLKATGVSDSAGNTLASNFNSDAFVVAPANISVGDPQFRVSTPPTVTSVVAGVPTQLLATVAPTSVFSSPLITPSLFEQPTLGNGVPPVGNIFINNQALASSFIAQVFSSSDSVGSASTSSGRFGFVGGDTGVFGSSTFAAAFGHASVPDVSPLNVFDGKQWHGSSQDAGDGARGVFGAPTLSQQLHQLKENERRQIHELALALEQIGASEAQA